jgi:hypothetical protein
MFHRRARRGRSGEEENPIPRNAGPSTKHQTDANFKNPKLPKLEVWEWGLELVRDYFVASETIEVFFYPL